MAMSSHSREANAAERFVWATRKVDMAFRATRAESSATDGAQRDHSRAVLELEQALEELAAAPALFDATVRKSLPRRS